MRSRSPGGKLGLFTSPKRNTAVWLWSATWNLVRLLGKYEAHSFAPVSEMTLRLLTVSLTQSTHLHGSCGALRAIASGLAALLLRAVGHVASLLGCTGTIQSSLVISVDYEARSSPTYCSTTRLEDSHSWIGIIHPWLHACSVSDYVLRSRTHNTSPKWGPTCVLSVQLRSASVHSHDLVSPGQT